MKYRKKPVVIEAITFDELVALGLKQHGVNIHNGMPWSFTYQDQSITHENDDCYLIPTLEGTMQFRRGDMLITGVKGEIYPCKPDIFAVTYEPVGDTQLAVPLSVQEAVRTIQKYWTGGTWGAPEGWTVGQRREWLEYIISRVAVPQQPATAPVQREGWG